MTSEDDLDFAALLEAELDEPAQETAQESSEITQPHDLPVGPSNAAPGLHAPSGPGLPRMRGRKRRRTSISGSADDGTPQCPPHPGVMHGICIRCGSVLVPVAEDHVPLRYIHQGLQISKAEADRIRTQGLQRTLGERKLLLVLDLDHTLLNSTRFEEVPLELSERLQETLDKEAGKPEQLLYRLENMAMWTKLRPCVREFLAAVHAIAEVYIYTHGNKDYAAAMASILDPERLFFKERIISQDDSTLRGVKHLDVMLGAESAVVIVDDTEGVWPHHLDNLIQVDRYIYFPADAGRFSAGPCLLERGVDESKEEGQLRTALTVLQALHQRMFSSPHGEPELDVRKHLQHLRAEVLIGVQVCFTRLIPLGTQEPEQHPLWRLAKRLGATCSLQLHEGVTHLVSGGPTTDKARLALKKGIPVVLADWLQASAFRWRRVSEEEYPAKELQQCEFGPVDVKADVKAALEAAGGGAGPQ